MPLENTHERKNLAKAFDRPLSRSREEVLVGNIKKKHPEVSLEYSLDEEDLERCTLVPSAAALKIESLGLVEKTCIKLIADWAKEYLSLPVFTDPFGDSEDEHVKRISWGAKIAAELAQEAAPTDEEAQRLIKEEYNYLFNKSKLKKSNINPLVSSVDFLLESFEKNKDKNKVDADSVEVLEELKQELQRSVSDAQSYQNLERKEKHALIGRLDRLCVKILNFFTEPVGGELPDVLYKKPASL